MSRSLITSAKKQSASPALQQLITLKEVYLANRYPNVPANFRPKPKYEDNTANGLTRCILDFIRFSGGFATRIQSQGQYRPGINGRRGQYTYGNTRKGTADIHAVANGFHISVEVKIGKDRMSKAQRLMQTDIQKAGGHYFVAHTFQDFYEFFTAEFLTPPFA
ncbi:VRR-NUC domain-containing protein [Spirosoma sp. HMF4905]|uniref:VRR-NUC domain-containing protein n=1 Tax=Spirosoma arboris TaxID=2682092 RepID=A0A7K1SQB9_9BACT|nr:VRR-NUC domain-containing protein [Spirosoma arboris]MVM36004.1 VRR-NUC domain-containing protein [Spirosoma arboris]